jgi:hypothetical protein
MATIFNFLICEVCGKEFNTQIDSDRRTTVDRDGFTHTFCADCFAKKAESE